MELKPYLVDNRQLRARITKSRLLEKCLAVYGSVNSFTFLWEVRSRINLVLEYIRFILQCTGKQ